MNHCVALQYIIVMRCLVYAVNNNCGGMVIYIYIYIYTGRLVMNNVYTYSTFILMYQASLHPCVLCNATVYSFVHLTLM